MQGEVPTVDFDISEVFDEEDDVALVSIKCVFSQHLVLAVQELICGELVCCFTGDEPLATAAGFDFKKLETGFDAGFVFMSRGE